MAFTMQVHERDHKDPSIISKVRPYLRFNEKGHPPVYIQDGKFYWEGGKHINQPERDCPWVFDKMDSLPNQAKKEVNYVGAPKKRGRPTKEVENGDDQSNRPMDQEGGS